MVLINVPVNISPLNQANDIELTPSKAPKRPRINAVPKLDEMFAEYDGQLMLIELQGTIESTSNSLEGLTLGKLEFENKPYLYIANHRIEGKVVNLEKPLVVLRTRNHQASQTCISNINSFMTPQKSRNLSNIPSSSKIKYPHQPFLPSSSPHSSNIQTSSPVRIADQDELDRERFAHTNVGERSCSIVAIIRKKIVFRNRPEPVIEL